MKLKTTLLASLEEDGLYFDYLRMRMEDEGLRIQAKSPLFASWFTEHASSTYKIKPGNPWAAGTFHNLGLDTIKGVKGFIYPDDYTFFHDGIPNLLWLCHKDLASGFDLLVKQTIALNNFEDYFAQSCEAVRDFYTTYLRKGSLEATFSELWKKEGKEKP